jgi:hypothetical protein
MVVNLGFLSNPLITGIVELNLCPEGKVRSGTSIEKVIGES